MMTRQGRPDDGLVEGGKEDADHDREEDAHPDRMRELDTGAMSLKVGTAWAWLADTRTSEALLRVAAGPDPWAAGGGGVDGTAGSLSYAEKDVSESVDVTELAPAVTVAAAHSGRSGGTADAAVLNTAEATSPCEFDSHLRHHRHGGGYPIRLSHRL